MDAADLGKRLEGEFPDVVKWTARSPKRLCVSLPCDHLYDVFDWIRDNVPGFRLGTSTGIDLREGVGVFHHFVVNETPLVVTLKMVAPRPDPHMPSLAAKIPSADWIEREMNDMLGIVFEGHPDLRRLGKAKAFSNDYPLRRDFDVPAFKERIGELPEF